MSDGGLLQKAIEQQSSSQDESVLVADVEPSDSKAGFLSGPIRSGAGLAVLALVISFVVSRLVSYTRLRAHETKASLV